VAKKLADSPLLLAASPAYLKQHGAPRTPAELRNHNCLAYTQAQHPHEWTFSGPDGATETVSVQGNLQANTSVALRAAALGGLGIISAAAFIVHEDVQRGALTALLPDYPQRPRELYALYPQSRHLSPKVRAFIDFAAAHYRERGWA
jgi:DNA-binding transcriptional LysR family regulator